MKRIFLGMTIAFFPSLQALSQPSFLTDSIDTYIERGMARWKIPGLSAAVVKDGKLVFAKGYGIREAGKPDRVDENTIFMIGSNTKAFTATAVCLLDYEHRLSLDDRVTKWIPDFRLYDTLATGDVRIRDLMCHRLGLETFQGDFVNWNSNLSRTEVIRNLRYLKPPYAFRTKYGYCNAAFLTAGEIVRIVSDTSWENFVRTRFFSPLRMSRTLVTEREVAQEKNRATPHTLVGDSLVKTHYSLLDNMAPAGSISSSALEMTHWLMMQLDSGKYNGKQVVPFEALRPTWTSHTVVRDMPGPFTHFITYGLGWQLADYSGRKIVSHTGGVDGFLTATCFIPELDLGIVVLTNTDQNSFYTALRNQIIEAYLGLPYRNISDIAFDNNLKQKAREDSILSLDRNLVARKLPPSLSLKRYTGKYTNQAYGWIEVKEEHRRLNIYFQHHSQLVGKLEARDGNTFLCTYSDPGFGVKVIPFAVENDNVKSVTIRVDDFIDSLPYEFTKIQ